MLVHQPSKRIILNLANPAKVTTLLPDAKAFDYKGHTLVAVPHRVDDVKVLRNLGIKAPSPVLYRYNWSGQFQPFFAQRQTVDFLTMHPRAFVLNDMGTGKSLATLWAFDYLRSIGRATKMLVVCPLSTMERTWADEVFRHFPHLNTSVIHGTKDRRLKLLAADADIYIINHHGVRTVLPDLLARQDIDTLVLDELAIYRNASTELWKGANKLAQGRVRVWGLTGTPTPNAPTDAWAQCRLIAPERVPRYFGAWRDAVMQQFGQFKWLPRPGSTDIVVEAMQPAIRFTRDQCVDLPDAIYQTRHAAMTPEQSRAYNDMLKQLFTEFNGDGVQAVNEAVKVSKLMQIACGVVYGTNGEEVVLPNKPRLDVVREVIDEAATKVIVFVPYKSVLRYVEGELSKTYKTASICGETSKSERDRIFSDFQHNAGGIQVLVAQPAAMSHGLTLTAASTVVWYSATTSNEIYEQANARITRPGQKHTQFLVNIEGSPVERLAFARLQKKQTMQGILLNVIKNSDTT